MTTTRERALEAPVCESCGEAPQEIHLAHAGLCGDCFAVTYRETVKGTFWSEPCGRPLFQDGRLVAVCCVPYGTEHSHEALPPSPQPPPVAEGEHTPGPWHLGTHGGSTDAYVWGADERQRGCIARVNLCAVDHADKAQREGNAHLIAAAPDMLAALRHIMLWADGTNHSACANVARAAIARATGREG